MEGCLSLSRCAVCLRLNHNHQVDKKPLSIELGTKKIPDVNRKDNEYYFVK